MTGLFLRETWRYSLVQSIGFKVVTLCSGGISLHLLNDQFDLIEFKSFFLNLYQAI
jgi:hypothetical protein